MKIKTPPPCVYKKSCGYEICLKEECPEYTAKKRGEPYFGTVKENESK